MFFVKRRCRDHVNAARVQTVNRGVGPVLERCVGCEIFGRNWFHTSYIGVAVAELQAKLRVRNLREDSDTREGLVSNALQRRELGCGSSWPTLVMPKCGKLRAFPPCAVGHFMSNIKMFPMALLPGWPFAPNKTPGAKTV